MLLPSRPTNELFHQPVIYFKIHYVTLNLCAYIGCCYVRQTSDKLLGCQEQHWLKRYA